MLCYAVAALSVTAVLISSPGRVEINLPTAPVSLFRCAIMLTPGLESGLACSRCFSPFRLSITASCLRSTPLLQRGGTALSHFCAVKHVYCSTCTFEESQSSTGQEPIIHDWRDIWEPTNVPCSLPGALSADSVTFALFSTTSM